jgi:predicted enzyme related to lactoylglutathione lyase
MHRLPALLLASSLAAAPLRAQDAPFVPDLLAVELPAGDVAATQRFWQEALGWELDFAVLPDHAVLRQGDLRLVLQHTERAPAPEHAPYLSINVRVPDLAAAADAVRAAGGTVVDDAPRPFALGQMRAVRDPSSNTVHLVVLTDAALPAGAPPRVFNVGWHVADLAATEAFWTRLGLSVFARDFLPKTLPMQRAGAAPLVFHRGAEVALPSASRRPKLYFAVPELARAASLGITRPPSGTPLGRALRLRDPDQLDVAIVERGAARAWYERLLRALPGAWRARSTQGWESDVRYAAIARGSVLVENDGQSDPANAMLTAIHMDGDRLLLTHFCHAGNQPRLCADLSTATEDAITFRFLDATNLASRDQGHMDQLDLRLVDPDHCTSQWHWYENGAARPFERIDLERVPDAR